MDSVALEAWVLQFRVPSKRSWYSGGNSSSSNQGIGVVNFLVLIDCSKLLFDPCPRPHYLLLAAIFHGRDCWGQIYQNSLIDGRRCYILFRIGRSLNVGQCWDSDELLLRGEDIEWNCLFMYFREMKSDYPTKSGFWIFTYMVELLLIWRLNPIEGVVDMILWLHDHCCAEQYFHWFLMKLSVH